MERTDFLKKAAFGSLALTSFGGVLAEEAAAGARHARNFYLVAMSGQDETLDGGESIFMTGCGSFSGPQVRGQGEFVRFDGTKIPSQDFLGTGRWTAKRVVEFHEVGAWGVLIAGILNLEIELVPEHAHPAPAQLTIVSNLEPAGISTGQDEGFSLEVPGTPTYNVLRIMSGMAGMAYSN